jgi:uncharacterized membrane protein (UPF0127 family)|tara:strand:- start:216 stop:356 length:141 start_codon:yes stop_codon:yes gene_type:complete
VDLDGDQILEFTEDQMIALNMKVGDTIVWNKNDETGEVSFTVENVK